MRETYTIHKDLTWYFILIQFLKLKLILGPWDSSVGKSAGCQDCWPGFELRIHCGKREQSPECPPLTPTHTPWCGKTYISAILPHSPSFLMRQTNTIHPLGLVYQDENSQEKVTEQPFPPGVPLQSPCSRQISSSCTESHNCNVTRSRCLWNRQQAPGSSVCFPHW